MNQGTIKQISNKKIIAKQNNIDKVKLNDLSHFIFNKIRQYAPIKDDYLMKLLIEQFGLLKIESLKRRKYDVINILQKADIISVQKINDNQIKYSPKSLLLNAVKDVEQTKKHVEAKKQIMKKRIEQLEMLKHTKKNLQKLAQINRTRQCPQNNKIQLPVLITTKKFTQITRDQDLKGRQSLILEFPPKTKYISNILGAENMIRTQL